MRQSTLAARFDAQRPRLQAVAYRILGSLSDSDDAVQEVWLRLQRADAAAIDNLDAWLTTVTARVSLNLLRDRRAHREGPLEGLHPEPVVSPASGTDPEREVLLADAVGIALQVVLDTLDPAQRLAFVLHDMFAVPFSEIAAILERTSDATRQLASRARRSVRDAVPEPEPDPVRRRAVVDAYFAATRDGDLDGLAAVLAPDVVLRAHRRDGSPWVLNGAGRVARGALMAQELAPFARPALVNGAAGAVAFDGDTPFAILAFVIAGGQIHSIDIFNDRELVPGLIGPGAW